MLFGKKKYALALLITISFLVSVFPPWALASRLARGPVFLPPISFTKDPPASFQNVTYKVKEGIVEADGKLGTSFQPKVKLFEELTVPGYESTASPKQKLKSMGMVRKSDFRSIATQYKKGTILLDRMNNLAIKVIDDVTLTGVGAGDYVCLKMPEVHEVLTDFSIPEQTVKLTRANITGFAPGVEKAAVAGDMAVRSATGGEETHLSDNPLIKFVFSPDETLIAFDQNGLKFDVKLDGYFGIDGITVEGYYYCNDGYRLVVKTAEELKLKLSCTAALDVDTKLTIPICGISVSAGFANVCGSIVIVAGADGNMELAVEAHQWLEAQAGIQGGTFLGVPTDYHVIQEIDHDFDVDLSFEGKINAYLKAGPVASLEIYGRDMAGAGLLIGLGGNVAISAGYGESTDLTAEVFGLLQVYVTLLDNKKSIVDKKLILYQLAKSDTAGYVIQFYEACMYRNTIWGNIRQAGSGTPFAGQAVLVVEKPDGTKTPLNVPCDEAGNFHVNVKSAAGLTLSKNDKIYINSIGKTAVTSDPIYPTFPFTEVVLEYVDFFNDCATGYVTPARVMNWTTGEYQYIYYTGDIQFSLWSKGSGTTSLSPDSTPGPALNPAPGLQPIPAPSPALQSIPPVLKTVACDSEGNFKLNHDFKPGDRARALLYAYETELTSETVAADTDIAGKHLKEAVKSDSVKDRFQTERRAETDHFLVYNLRGTKAVTQPGNLSVSYDYYKKPISYYLMGDKIAGHTHLGTVNLTLNMSAIHSNVSSLPKSPITREPSLSLPLMTGVSETFAHYITEYVWGEKGTDPKITLTEDIPITLRYIHNGPKIDSATGQGVDFIARSGSLSFDYEGAQILNIAIEPDFKVSVIGLGESIRDGIPVATSHPLIKEVKTRTAPFYNNASAWAIPELNKAKSMGLVPGSLMGVDLTLPATRGEFAAVSVKIFEALSGAKLLPAASNPFTDTDDIEVLKAYNAGITAGMGGGIFAPDSLLTREQAATMLTRVFKKASIPGWTLETDSQFTLKYTKPLPFADDSNISSWAKDSVYFMAANGVLKGIGNNSFGPRPITAAEIRINHACATREQALLIAVRMLGNLK